MRIFAFHHGVGCQSSLHESSSDPSSTGATLGLTQAVGGEPRCPNLGPDVMKVQNALNRFPQLEGGPDPKLVPNGICDKKTKDAIVAFQKKHFGADSRNRLHTDGVVDPGKKTDQELCQPSAVYDSLPAEMETHRQRTLSMLNITRSALASARLFKENGERDNFNFIGKPTWEKLKLHFQVDRFPGSRGWSDAMVWIEKIYLDMVTALGHIPQGMAFLQDEPLFSNEGADAFTFVGGYHRKFGDQITSYKGLQKNYIYLCAKMQQRNGDDFCYILIHECAHFVGPTDDDPRGLVDDYGYAFKSDGKYNRLLPWQRLHNADCYAQFAFATNNVNSLTYTRKT